MFMAAMILMIAGTAISAYGQYQAGVQAQKAGDYQASIARQQAQVAQQKAAFEATKLRERGERLKASQRTGYAGRGISLSSGTVEEVLTDTAGDIKLDELAILYGGSMEAQGLHSQAQYSEWAGKQKKKAGTIGAIGSLLTGAGQAGLTAGSMAS